MARFGMTPSQDLGCNFPWLACNGGCVGGTQKDPPCHFAYHLLAGKPGLSCLMFPRFTLLICKMGLRTPSPHRTCQTPRASAGLQLGIWRMECHTSSPIWRPTWGSLCTPEVSSTSATSRPRAQENGCFPLEHLYAQAPNCIPSSLVYFLLLSSTGKVFWDQKDPRNLA